MGVVGYQQTRIARRGPMRRKMTSTANETRRSTTTNDKENSSYKRKSPSEKKNTTNPEMASSIGSTFTILTGGAIGTDSLAEECAKEWGMHVKLFLAPHHHRVSEKHPAIPHQKLMNRLPFVQTASQRLKRHPSKNPFVRDLLARNWFIVNQAKVLYAYANFEDDSLTTVEGGTGMTVQMGVDHNRDYPDFWKDVFVFDESRQKWYELEREDMRDPDDEDFTFTDALGPLAFRECLCGPILHPVSAVVGSRTLGELGRRILKDQFKRTVKEHARGGQTQMELHGEVEKVCKLFQEMSLKEKSKPDVLQGEIDITYLDNPVKGGK